MEIAAAKLIGAGLATIALLGVGIGLGNIFSAQINAIARNPSAADEVRRATIFGFAMTEAIGLFALLIALLILFAF